MSRPEGRRGGRGVAAVLLLVLAGLTAISVVPVWFTTSGTTALDGTADVSVTGTDVAPGILAAAVALLAAAAAVGLVGRVGRWIVALVAVGCGVLVVATTASVLSDPEAAVIPVVADRTGIGHLAGPVSSSLWPTVALVVGVLVVLAAGWLVVVSRGWSGPTRRYQATPTAAGTSTTPDERADWDALSRGDDPS